MKKVLFPLFLIMLFLTLSGCETQETTSGESESPAETIFLERFNVKHNLENELPIPEIEGEKFIGWSLDQEGALIVEEKEDYEDYDSLYPVFETKGEENVADEELLFPSTPDMIEEVEKSIVGIRNLSEGEFEDDEMISGFGSGIVYKIKGNTHYVVTNNHVVSGNDSIEVSFERKGNIFEVEETEFIGGYKTADIAILSFEWENEDDFEVAEFDDTSKVRRGENVVAIGSPLGERYFGTATKGIVSYPSRFIDDPEKELNTFFIQHDAAISPGNSGGALFNQKGEVLGINTLKIVQQDVEGMGFAVPSNTIQRVINDLEEFGEVEEPFLGISSLVNALDCEGDYGVCVSEVVEGGAGEKAGLREGDLITQIENETSGITSDIYNFENLRESIVFSRVGDEVRLLVTRDGEMFWTKIVELGSR